MEADKRRLMDHLILDQYSESYERYYQGFLNTTKKDDVLDPRAKCWEIENKTPAPRLNDITCEDLRADPCFKEILDFIKQSPGGLTTITTSRPRDIILMRPRDQEEISDSDQDQVEIVQLER